MLGDTPVTVYWTMLYNSCILLIYSFCDSSHIVTKRSILFEFRLRLQAPKTLEVWEKVDRALQGISSQWG